jgi:hypothetical protein
MTIPGMSESEMIEEGARLRSGANPQMYVDPTGVNPDADLDEFYGYEPDGPDRSEDWDSDPAYVLPEDEASTVPPLSPNFVSAMAPDEIDRCEPLAKLQAERLAYAKRHEALWPMYGPLRMYDDYRKQLLSALERRALNPLADDPPAPAKTTDGAIDAWAHAHPAYLAYLDQAKAEASEFQTLTMALLQIQERIRRGDSVMYLAARESLLPQR